MRGRRKRWRKSAWSVTLNCGLCLAFSLYLVFSLCLAFTLCLAFPVSVSANSAQSDWDGTYANGTISKDEECPVIVERELLTFDVPEFPKSHYERRDAFLSYNGSVSAEYTFYNPENYTVTATLLFPFGKAPDYGFQYDTVTMEECFGADTEKYGVTVNGEEIEKTLRHTYAADDFELERDMAKLHDGYAEDPFYDPDMPVTKYTYTAGGIDPELDAASAGFRLSGGGGKTKVYMEDSSGYNRLGKEVEISAWVNNGVQVDVYMIGEQPEELPDWYICENGAMEKQTDGEMNLTDVEEMTFREFTMMSYDPDSHISETDWYNAVIYEMNLYEKDFGFIESFFDKLDVSDTLMRWYEYEITIEPGGRITNEVTAPVYPEIHGESNLTYDYTYLLSPAQTWKEFHDLEVVIRTPYIMRESSLEGFEKTEDGYTLAADSLPPGELEFTLAETEGSPLENQDSDSAGTGYPAGYFLAAAVFVLAAGTASGVIFVRRRKKKR